jgi:transposase-like protein
MSDPNDDIKRWTARRKATAVMDIIKGKTTAAELARSHDLTVAEVEQWMDDFVSQGTEALRSQPCDREARHRSEKKDLLAKIGELTMEKEVYKAVLEIQGKPLPDVNS